MQAGSGRRLRPGRRAGVQSRSRAALRECRRAAGSARALARPRQHDHRRSRCAGRGAGGQCPHAETPVPLAARRGVRSFRWWHVAGVGFALGAVLVALLAWMLPRELGADAAARDRHHARGGHPAGDCQPRHRSIRSRSRWRAASARACARRPKCGSRAPMPLPPSTRTATSSASIMATLQTDAVIELLPGAAAAGWLPRQRPVAGGWRRAPVAAAVGPAATLEGLGDALASALAHAAAPESGSVARPGACGRRARQPRGARALRARAAADRHRECRRHRPGMPVVQGLHRCGSGALPPAMRAGRSAC